MKMLRALLTLLALMLGIPAATNAQTIAEIASGDTNFTILVQAITSASQADTDFLGTISSDDADLTVFAPTDAAFQALGSDVLAALIAKPEGLLTDILSYHLLDGAQSAADLITAGTVTTLLGPTVSFSVNDDGEVFVNNSQITMIDIQADNGVIHVIDAVLSPPSPADEGLPTIAEIAAANGDFTLLLQAVNTASAAGVIDFAASLADPEEDLTVFAPTDNAFAALGVAFNDALADPAGLLTDILAYHILESSEFAGELSRVDSFPTLLGESVMISTDAGGNVFINGNQIAIADIEAENGVVHILDVVLNPDEDPEAGATIIDLAAEDPDLSSLVQALEAASAAGDTDFIALLSDPNAQFTVFAPTDAAFEALGDALDTALADPAGLLSEILKYHVLTTPGTAVELLTAGMATTTLGENITIMTDASGNAFINDSQLIMADIMAATESST